jgi:hypothetical protein
MLQVYNHNEGGYCFKFEIKLEQRLMGCINDEVHRDQRRKTGHMDERFHLEEGHLIWAQPLSVAARKSYSDKENVK